MIECKNYNHSVPIDDIEEFKSKLDQIGSAHCKGIMCTRIGFQKSTLNYAKWTGIGLCRISETDDLNWDLERINSNYNNISVIPKSVEDILTNAYKRIAPGFFAGYFGSTYSYSLFEYLSDLMSVPLKKKNTLIFNPSVEYLSEEDIKKILIEEFVRLGVKIQNNYQTSFESYMSLIEKNITIVDSCDLGLDKSGNRIIGRLKGNNIYTYERKDFSNPRYNITLAHEVGHWYLHSKTDWYMQYVNIYNDIDLNDYGNSNNDKVVRRIEKQANIFASNLLLPDLLVNNRGCTR